MTSKKKFERVQEQIHIQTCAIQEAFKKLVTDSPQGRPWRFTYSVVLSAEPIPMIKQEVTATE